MDAKSECPDNSIRVHKSIRCRCSDLHTLFDRGHLGIDPDDLKVTVSSRIKEQFSNGDASLLVVSVFESNN